MDTREKAVSYIISVVATPMIAALLSLVLLAILNVTNLLLILTIIGFAVISSDLIIFVALHGRSRISEVFSLKNIAYYMLCIGVSIITCYAIFFVTTTFGTKYEGNPFALSLAGGITTIIIINAIFLRKILVFNHGKNLYPPRRVKL
ncbi:MAG TPA: hypothetical protein EYH59_04765 [Pyrodictium sp.]|nr:hypothetical protein [Pyrodictium sp.]